MNFVVFFNDTATTEIYTLSLHDALPISQPHLVGHPDQVTHGYEQRDQGEDPVGEERLQEPERRDEQDPERRVQGFPPGLRMVDRTGEDTAELPSRPNILCRLLLLKKKKIKITIL